MSNTASEGMVINKPLRKRDIVTYSLGSLGREVSNNAINVFFLAYLNIYLGLNALVLTIAFVIAKIWDTVNDPLLATLVNNTKKSKRFGRYIPWVALGAFLNAISVVLMFTKINTTNVIGKYSYYIFMYILWGMTFTLVDVPFWSMLPTIADSTEERNKFSSMAKLIGGFGGFVISSIGTSVVLPKYMSQSFGKAYFVLGLCIAGIMFGFISVTVICNKEKYDIPNEKVDLRSIFALFKENDQLKPYAISLVLFVSATTISLSQLLYLFIYSYPNGTNLFSDKYSYTIFFVVACTGQGIAMFFYHLLTKKFKREKVYGANFFFGCLSMLLMFFIFMPLKPGKYLVNTILVALSGAFLMVANGLNQIGSTVMIADVVDYGEWKTGKRGDSIIFSVQTLLTKFAGAIAMLLLGIGIQVARLPNAMEEYDIASGQMVQQFRNNSGEIVDFTSNNRSLTILRAFMFLVPIPLIILGYIVYKKQYRLYGEYYDNIKKEIDERRIAENQETVASGDVE